MREAFRQYYFEGEKELTNRNKWIDLNANARRRLNLHNLDNKLSAGDKLAIAGLILGPFLVVPLLNFLQNFNAAFSPK